MSIHPVRVVWRIARQVACEPVAAAATARFEAADFREPAAGHRLHVARAAGSDTQAFPSLFHFWARGLLDFLDAQRMADQFEAAAGFAICERIDRDAFAGGLGGHTRALVDGDLVRETSRLPGGRWREAYRMIDGPCRASSVAASDEQWLAYYWAHGIRAAGRPVQPALQMRDRAGA